MPSVTEQRRAYRIRSPQKEQVMAAVWFTQIVNASDSDYTLDFTDQTWRPIVNGERYDVGRLITVPRRRSSAITIPSPLPWIPPITVPPGPTNLDLQYAFVGWADFAHTRLAGPRGFVDFVVGPIDTENADYLRALDDTQANVVEPVPVGPRGGGWIASMDLHLVITNEGIRPVVWSYTGIGANILERFDSLATLMAEQLVRKVVDGLPIKFGS
jgi:hypothetical protein